MIFSLAITGPTASGKTALSLDFAERLGGEIISCDSMQIYKGMDIGTAKATAEEQRRAKHHLIDFLDPKESFSVEAYREMAIAQAREISERGRVPIFVGGTGLYVDALMRAPQISAPESDPEYRAAIIESIHGDEDVHALWERLRSVDPESAEAIHKNNIKRVIRALEIYDKTGITKSELDKRSRLPSPEIFVGMITLDFHDRELLYSRIDKRVDIMMEEGLLCEVRTLFENKMIPSDSTAAQAIGYKELISYLKGEEDLPSAIESIKLASRRYAKRQLTWFRHVRDAKHLYADDLGTKQMRPYDSLLSEALSLAKNFREEYFNITAGRVNF